jgi:hypothetical protein
MEFAGRNGWLTAALGMDMPMANNRKPGRKKIEALAASYPVFVQLDSHSKKKPVTREGRKTEARGGQIRARWRICRAFCGAGL